MTGILCSFAGGSPMNNSLQYLIIAGGGGGGWSGNGYAGGGGGAGGYIEGSLFDVNGESFTITIGSGGTVYYTYGRGQTGGNSVLSNGSWFVATALGGGGGGGVHADGGASGGSGGAGSAYVGGGGAGLQPSQTGYSQGFGSNGYNLKGGGAGGINGYPKSSDITGTTVYYAGGGNGLGNSSYYGDGGNTNTVGKPGIVILRSTKSAKSYTGSPSISSSGDDTIYTFTGAGSITF